MAIEVVREITVDLVKRGSAKTVYAKQNDYNSRFLHVRIQDDGKDVVIEPDLTVVLNVERSDKEEKMIKGTVNFDGTVRIPFTSWMLELEGNLICDISIIDEDPSVAKLTTMQFNIYVERTVVTDTDIAESEDFGFLKSLLDRITYSDDVLSRVEASGELLDRIVAMDSLIQQGAGTAKTEVEAHNKDIEAHKDMFASRDHSHNFEHNHDDIYASLNHNHTMLLWKNDDYVDDDSYSSNIFKAQPIELSTIKEHSWLLIITNIGKYLARPGNRIKMFDVYPVIMDEDQNHGWIQCNMRKCEVTDGYVLFENAWSASVIYDGSWQFGCAVDNHYVIPIEIYGIK